MAAFWVWARTNRRFAMTASLSILWLYALCWRIVAPDLPEFLFPWFDHIVRAGPVGAFATPFSNYSPPYLYLMAAGSLLTSTPFVVIKVLAVVGSVCVAVAMARLLRGSPKRYEAALFSFLIPTVAINAVVYGQCDGYWTAASVMAVASAAERRHAAMLAWCGLAFAFKAQAIFLAPFVVAVLLQRRVPALLWLIPPAVYSAAMFPAWLAGWPAADLATIYLRQAQYFNTVGSAPNPWAIVAVFVPREPSVWFPIGYGAAAVAVGAYIAILSRRALAQVDLLRAALLSAMIVPFLLPKMHERFTLLADILSFGLAYTTGARADWRICFAVIAASTLATFGAMFDGSLFLLFPAVASALNAAAIFMVSRSLADQGLIGRRGAQCA